MGKTSEIHAGISLKEAPFCFRNTNGNGSRFTIIVLQPHCVGQIIHPIALADSSTYIYQSWLIAGTNGQCFRQAGCGPQQLLVRVVAQYPHDLDGPVGGEDEEFALRVRVGDEVETIDGHADELDVGVMEKRYKPLNATCRLVSRKNTP